MPDACLFVGSFGLLEQGGCDMRSGVTCHCDIISALSLPPATAAASAAANKESAICNGFVCRGVSCGAL
jgi:hypothetical protein